MKTYIQFIAESASGLYTFRRLDPQSADFLYEWMRENRIPNPSPPSELHCTIIYSEVDVPGYTVDPTFVMLNPATYKIGMMNQALTVQFKSDPLLDQWQRAMNLGARGTYPSFIPHITLSYEVPMDYDYHELKPPPTFIILEGEEAKINSNDGNTSINEYTIGDMTLGGGPEIYVPQTSLNMSRNQMPQITQANTMEFIDWLEEQGITVQFVAMPVALLKSAQADVDRNKVFALQNSSTLLSKPFIVSKNNYILDGKHRWLALLNRDPHISVDAYRVNLPIQNLLDMANKFSKTMYVS